MATEDGETSGPRAVVAGHGSFAAGAVSAVQQISGRGASLSAVSNTGMSPGDIESTIAGALDASASHVVFTDLPAGSCTMAARRLQRSRPDLIVVTGVNLATLLEFVFRPGDEGVGDAARAAAEKGRATLVVHGV